MTLQQNTLLTKNILSSVIISIRQNVQELRRCYEILNAELYDKFCLYLLKLLLFSSHQNYLTTVKILQSGKNLKKKDVQEKFNNEKM